MKINKKFCIISHSLPRSFFDQRTANGFSRAVPELSKSITYVEDQILSNEPIVQKLSIAWIVS